MSVMSYTCVSPTSASSLSRQAICHTFVQSRSFSNSWICRAM